MTYQALARKWRPKRFSDVVGQTHIVKTLGHALDQNKVHHAYLFTGTHGVGKTTLARLFAKSLNCDKGITSTPCEQCPHCLEINEGRFPDLYEIDAASRTKVEDTRELLDNIPYAPTKGRFKVYLIDEVHMLSGHSFNALLKTLEEPPSHVKFLLATTDPQKLPATVLSRCLQFHLSKINVDQIEKQLALILSSEQVDFEPTALSLIADAANGSMRDALTLLDQCIAYGGGKIQTADIQALLGLSSRTEMTALIKAIDQQDASAALQLTRQWAEKGVHFSRCLSELLTQLYQISITQMLGTATASELNTLAQTLSRENVQLYYQIALIGQRDLPLAPNAQIGFEMIVMRMMAFTPSDKQQSVTQKTPEKAAEKISEKPVTQTTSKENVTSSDWQQLLSQLKLTGPTLALAQHCSMRACTAHQLQLSLHTKYAALLTAKLQQRIQDAVTENVSASLKVVITIEENTSETPAELAVRTQKANQESAKQAITDNATVQRIVKTFDAKIIEDSIEPLNH